MVVTAKEPVLTGIPPKLIQNAKKMKTAKITDVNLTNPSMLIFLTVVLNSERNARKNAIELMI
ncbi:MAG: hypothetical protein PHG63_02975 [Candidatus Dojkabacteria bacterium]|nr:hypothetical protein [Candidatus Dojkabacteria bacterium]